VDIEDETVSVDCGDVVEVDIGVVETVVDVGEDIGDVVEFDIEVVEGVEIGGGGGGRGISKISTKFKPPTE
jgi:hypothetical protein